MDYRPIFGSFIKEVIKSSNQFVFNRHCLRPYMLRPYTFSAYFPELKGREGNFFITGNKLILSFSTCSEEVIASFYNGLICKRKYSLLPTTNHLSVRYISLGRRVAIQGRVAVFRTVSPVLISTRGKANHYLLPQGEELEAFEEGLKFAVMEAAQAFLGEGVDTSIRFQPLSVRSRVIYHYNAKLRGFVGVFALEAAPALLNLLYDIGLGARRSQGFGMLDLVHTAPSLHLLTSEGGTNA